MFNNLRVILLLLHDESCQVQAAKVGNRPEWASYKTLGERQGIGDKT